VIDGCTSPQRARGWCSKHYQRWSNHGDPNQVAWERNNPHANFWVKVDRRGPDECWQWLAYKDDGGYGHFMVTVGTRQRDVAAHRMAYQLEVGRIPDGLQIDHVCHTNDKTCLGGITCPHRGCVNPAHLEPVLPVENIRRAPISPGQRRAAQQRAKTHCAQGHPYDEANTYVDSNGYRACRACNNGRKRHRRARAKQHQ